MKKCYLGIDAGSYSFKGVILDSKKKIICSSYRYNKNNNVLNIKKLLSDLFEKIDFKKYKIVGIGVTGSYRKIMGLLLETDIVKNEILCHSVGGIYFYNNIDTVVDIGENNIKIINICNSKIINYSINNLDISNDGEVDKCFRNKYYKRVSIQGGYNNSIVDIIKKHSKCIYLNDNSYFMGAIGVALIALNSGKEKDYNIKIDDIKYDIGEIACERCNNKCNIVCICKNNEILAYRGNKCGRNVNKINIGLK